MSAAHDPLLTPELVDLILWHLHPSHADLRSCALVTRGWTYPAQAHLLRTVRLSGRPSSWPVVATLAAHTHLVQHVRRLRILRSDAAANSTDSDNTSFEDALEQLRDAFVRSSSTINLAEVTFAHLKNAVSTRTFVVLQCLLSLPSVESVEMQCMFPSIGDFVRLWSRCSSRVKHLHLIYAVRPSWRGKDDDGEELRVQRSSKIALESFSTISSTEDPALRLLPFDFFALKTLTVLHLRQNETKQLFARNYATLRELNLGIPDPDPYPRFSAPPSPATPQPSPVDLTLLPRTLGLSFPTIPKTLQTALSILATLPEGTMALKTVKFTPVRHINRFMPSPVGMPEARALDERLAQLSVAVLVDPKDGGPEERGEEEVWEIWRSELHRVERVGKVCRRRRCFLPPGLRVIVAPRRLPDARRDPHGLPRSHVLNVARFDALFSRFYFCRFPAFPNLYSFFPGLSSFDVWSGNASVVVYVPNSSHSHFPRAYRGVWSAW
ncbi:NmrA domain-containing protein [Mycena chlorophos]|uniref:NmrA domain-containing protein n=1 Tax=Mycena chlorophos TaxID=658473 RepID=A0A8H6VVU5_MYCCL|nr:NmrA domain-containing protein [Mycena chlorophos]